MNETQTFELPINEFDLNLLPENCRATGSEAFRTRAAAAIRRCDGQTQLAAGVAVGAGRRQRCPRTPDIDHDGPPALVVSQQ